MKKLLFFVSGNGTNLNFILEHIKNKNLFNCEIVGVISNRNCLGLKIAQNNNILSIYYPWVKKKEDRVSYDKKILSYTHLIHPDIIVLAGWNHILGTHFVDNIKNSIIINLHPALINTFPGNNAIEEAWNAAQRGKTHKTGIMVHTVTNQLDVGDVISEKEIEIKYTYKLKDLEYKIKYEEKYVLQDALEKLSTNLFKKGKVKDIYDLGDNRLLIMHTDRLSSCNKVVAELEGKGNLLSLLTNYWFSKTKDVVKNHVIEQKNNYLIVEKCELIPIEFIVRGYITGSMWKKYSEGERYFCGNKLSDNLKQYQKLERFIITPTTKDNDDLPITYSYILEQNILNKNDLDSIYEICCKLYIMGQYECDKTNLIMCDTKYEFGRNHKGEIVLIDEIHTIESSRYWDKGSYKTRIDNGDPPKNYDKDIIRDYVRKGLFIPDEKLKTLLSYYKHVYENLSKQKIDSYTKYSDLDINKILETL
tara:strand:- start:559 stop:1986 length:1428 start_codon:yes stop_codon:yes gene_type:complete